MSEFPRGQAPGNPGGGEDIASGAGAAGHSAGGAEPRAGTGEAGSETASAPAGQGGTGERGGEPGFDEAAGDDALPSMQDTPPSMADGASTGGEGRPGSTHSTAGQVEVGVSIPGLPGVSVPGLPGLPGLPGAAPGGGMPGRGAQASGGTAGRYPGSAGASQGSRPGSEPASATSTGSVIGSTGSVTGSGPGSVTDSRPGSVTSRGPGSARGSGPGVLTSGEQVAILDGELERGMGEFDAMILEQQTARRRAQREQGRQEPVQTASAGGVIAGQGGNESGQEGGFGRATGGSYSVGGGMGGVGAGRVPTDTARYPPPADIPSGNDDDVVARQLREAAMREADPAVREKLWAEYRKYKGIKQP